MTFRALAFAGVLLWLPFTLNAGEDFFLPGGAEGDYFEIQAKIDPPEVGFGEKARFQILVIPKGKVKAGPSRLELDQVAGWPRSVVVEPASDGFSWVPEFGGWVMEFVLTPRNFGVFNLPEIPLVYINPAIGFPSKRKMLVFSSQTRLVVHEPDEIPVPQLVLSPVGPTQTGGQVRVFWLEKALVGALLPLAVWLSARMIRNHLKNNAAYLRVGKGGWFQARLMKEPFGELGAHGWMSILQEYFSATFEIPTGVVTSGEIREGLLAKQLDQDVARGLAGFVERTEEYAFAPKRPFEEVGWRAEARQWLLLLESRR